MTGSRAIAALVSVSLGAGSACASAPARPHPIIEMEDRVRPRIARIPLAVRDAERAERVRAIYVELERLIANFRLSRAHLLWQITNLRGNEPDLREQLTQRIHELREAGVQTMEAYVEAQLELRTLLTPEEFARIDAMR